MGEYVLLYRNRYIVNIFVYVWKSIDKARRCRLDGAPLTHEDSKKERKKETIHIMSTDRHKSRKRRQKEFEMVNWLIELIELSVFIILLFQGSKNVGKGSKKGFLSKFLLVPITGFLKGFLKVPKRFQKGSKKVPRRFSYRSFYWFLLLGSLKVPKRFQKCFHVEVSIGSY